MHALTSPLALRELFPGINDPFTACSCVDSLGPGLAPIMSKGEPLGQPTDDDGRVRVVLDTTTFGGMTNAAFDQIRQHGSGHVAIVTRILEVPHELVGLAAGPSK